MCEIQAVKVRNQKMQNAENACECCKLRKFVAELS